MKKIYYRPEAEILELTTSNILAVSVFGNENNDNNEDNWANEYDAAENRGAWDDIWSYM